MGITIILPKIRSPEQLIASGLFESRPFMGKYGVTF